MSRTTVDAVVVSAGAGRRMGGAAKGLLTVAGRPALAWSLEALAADPRVQRIALVVPAEQLVDYASLDWLPDRVVTIVAGGATRSASVAAGIAALVDAPGSAAEMMLIHDAARPLLDASTLDRVILATAEFGAAIPAIPIADTLKRVMESHDRTDRHAVGAASDSARVSGGSVDRSSLVAAQTPQGIAARHLPAFVDALRTAGDEATDDASLLERLGIEVRIVEGDARLRKLTLPSDLVVIEAMASTFAPSRLSLSGLSPETHGLSLRSSGAAPEAISAMASRVAAVGRNLRIGWGDDAHPVGTSGTLMLGGVEFPGSPALSGHSDGDVVLHAVADALLGAARLGDLGRLFPADERTPAGVASSKLLAEVRRRVAEAGVAPFWLDLTITAKAPRLADRLEEIATSIAAVLEMPSESVSVKASTGNLIGDEGEGRAIRCQALLLAEHMPS